MQTAQDPAAPLFACDTAANVLGLVEAALDPRSLLSPVERARSSALAHPRDEEAFVAARVLARLLLLRLDDRGVGLTSLADFTLTQQCPECSGAHGRPAVDVPGTAVSWAHSGGFVAAAVGPGSVGVDVEPGGARQGRVPVSGTARSWVRSEAIIKWGHGDIDAALHWQPHLQGAASRRGRQYVIDADGLPRRTRLPVHRRPRAVVVTDASGERAGRHFVCSVAAPTRARWVDALIL